MTIIKDNSVQMTGKVVDVLPNTRFKVELENGLTVLATISGKMRINHIRILEGDRVLVEFSVYDLTLGRIIRRL